LPPSAEEQAANVALTQIVNRRPPDDAHYIAYRTLPPTFNGMKVFMDTQRAMYEEVFGKWDAHSLGTAFTLPIFIVQGENDLNTPVSVAKQYFDELTAPKKAFVIIHGAGHNTLAFASEILRFLNENVRPVVLEPGRP
jgi:pimeloyl-ACP methyl ester carboxylesterase